MTIGKHLNAYIYVSKFLIFYDDESINISEKPFKYMYQEL